MLPISVVIPTTRQPYDLPVVVYQQFLLAGIVASHLHIVTEPIGNANIKRNKGTGDDTQPYLFFCDDDVLMKPGALFNLLEAALQQPNYGYYYGDFINLNHPCEPHNWVHRAGIFDRDRLRRENYISTMSLIRRSSFEAVGGFDPAIERLQDYDLWLNMLQHGIEGYYVPGVVFATDYEGGGITQKTGYIEALSIIKAKYKL